MSTCRRYDRETQDALYEALNAVLHSFGLLYGAKRETIVRDYGELGWDAYKRACASLRKAEEWPSRATETPIIGIGAPEGASNCQSPRSYSA